MPNCVADRVDGAKVIASATATRNSRAELQSDIARIAFVRPKDAVAAKPNAAVSGDASPKRKTRPLASSFFLKETYRGYTMTWKWKATFVNSRPQPAHKTFVRFNQTWTLTTVPIVNQRNYKFMTNLKKFGILLLALGVSTSLFAAEEKQPAPNEKPDGTISFTGKSFALGIGKSWGEGTLHYKGKDYPIKVNGLALGKVGMTSATARGNVYDLKRLQDFNGNYTSTGVGMTLAGGRSATAMKNQNGVKLAVYSTSKGLDVTIGGAGVDMELKK